MAYAPKWNGYTARGLVDEIKASAVRGKQTAFNCDPLQSADDVFRRNLEIAKIYDEIESYVDQLNELMKKGGGAPTS